MSTYAERVAAGICPVCLKVMTEKDKAARHGRCINCFEKRQETYYPRERAARRARRAELISRHICPECKRQTPETLAGKSYCKDCQAKKNKHIKDWRRDQNEREDIRTGN